MNFSGINSRSIFGRLLRLPLRLIPPTLVMPILQGRLRGKRWITGSATHGCWLGSYEFAKQKLFEQHLKSGDTVYDIGANVGFYSMLSAEIIGETGQVHAFEPLPQNIEYLKRHIKLNHYKNIAIHEVAVAESTRTAKFATAHDRSMGKLSDKGELFIPVVTLDDYIVQRRLPMPSLIKIDIEGAEHLLLQGAQNTLTHHNIKLFIAIHNDQARSDCFSLLAQFGYHSIESISDLPLEMTDEIMASKAELKVTALFRKRK